MKAFGYDRASLLKKFTPQEDVSLALDSVDLLRQGRLDRVEQMLDPSVRDSGTHEALTEMHNMFPTEDASGVKPVEEGFVRGPNGSTTNITLEYEFLPQVKPTSGSTELLPRRWLLTQVVIQTSAGGKTIRGLHAMPIARSYEEMNEFTLADKGISQYAALLLVIGVSTFTLYVFVLCVRAKVGKQKWLWLILVLIGLIRVTVNWTTGQWFFTPLTIQIPPVEALAALYGPWMFQICAPLGALAFLVYRPRLISGAIASSNVPASTSEQVTESHVPL